MKLKQYPISFIVSVFALFFTCTAYTQILPNGVALKVVIIRHGEKPDSGNNLSCAGLNRALALPPVLDTITGKPDYTYVPTISTGKKTGSVRMFQTVTPFAVRDSLKINSSFNETDSTAAANDVLRKRGVVLMVWEHSNIPPLARALGVPGVLNWKGADFDSIWIIEYTADKKNKLKFLSFTIEQENIYPSPVCR